VPTGTLVACDFSGSRLNHRSSSWRQSDAEISAQAPIASNKFRLGCDRRRKGQQRVFMDLGLKGCRALVAGASKGLGKACAESLIGEGARVFICARNWKEIEGTAAEIKAEGYLDADVSRPEEVSRLVAKAIELLGGLDILVTNAGGPPTGPFDKAPDKDWDIAYQLNLMSAVRLIREALPALKASGRGRIINLTGYGVKEPMTDLVVSDSVRAGVTVMAKTIASDLAPFGITVNNIAPGPIMTDRLIEILAARAKSLGISVGEQFKRFAETIPVRRMGQPKEIGDLCAFLCSPQAGYLTGQAIVVDGGVSRSI
jgi:3-oxoacyl-[acyl-carrier protein] reductase